MTNQETIVPSNPADQKKLRDGLQEVVNAKIRIASERDYIKESIAELAKKFNVSKRDLNKAATSMFKGNYEEEAAKFEAFSTLYETLMNKQQ